MVCVLANWVILDRILLCSLLVSSMRSYTNLTASVGDMLVLALPVVLVKARMFLLRDWV